MTTADANSMVYNSVPRFEYQSLRQFLIYSLIMHGSLALIVAVSAYIQFRSTEWGGVGGVPGGTKVNLVSAAGIPMPKETVVTESKAVDPTKGLNKEEPPKPEPKTDATKIRKFKEEPRLPPSRPSRTLTKETPPPENAVPYGKGGNPDLPTGYSQTPGGGSSGVSTPGQGGGDFATRYGWYIDAAERRVSPNWNVLMLDPAARSGALHCVISFRILRDGSIQGLRVEQSSGNASFDNSGLRAIQSSIPFAPLPGDWRAPDVSVLWDFPDRKNP